MFLIDGIATNISQKRNLVVYLPKRFGPLK